MDLNFAQSRVYQHTILIACHRPPKIDFLVECIICDYPEWLSHYLRAFHVEVVIPIETK